MFPVSGIDLNFSNSIAHYQIVFEAAALRPHGGLTRVKNDYFSGISHSAFTSELTELGIDPHVLMHQLMKNIIETP